MQKTPPMLFEVSWEVANKVGGIYTVITSKVPLMKMNYDNYFLIGPLFDYLPIDFIPQQAPAPIAEVFDNLAKQGIKCQYGIWDIQGRPTTILIDARSLDNKKDEIKGFLFDAYGIDSLFAGEDFNEPLIWSWGVGEFLKEIDKQFKNSEIIGHFHEWLSGFALLNCHNDRSSISTVFTTHATMLGRSIASDGTDLVSILDKINPMEEAKKRGVLEKHTTEKACAEKADVFTTVSQTTAYEASKLFGVEADVLPNGLALDSYPTFEGASYQHLTNKHKLQRHIMSHFFPYQTFDLDETLFFYTSGRYEYVNKGMDLTIEALAKLNEQLKNEGSKKTVVMFFFLLTTAGGPRVELLENANNFDELLHTIQDKSKSFYLHIIENLLTESNKPIEFCSDDCLQQMRRRAKTMKRKHDPPLSTHEIDEQKDIVLQKSKQLGLFNRSDDRVKIVLVPAFLNGRDGFIDMDYNNAVSACHLGIFPSNYEPWGYTPLESLALGVPAITTTNAGFGQHVKDKIVGEHPGVFIINKQQERQKVLDDLYRSVERFAFLSKQDRVASKMNAHALSTYADWRQLIRHYLAAHQKALKLTKQQLKQDNK